MPGPVFCKPGCTCGRHSVSDATREQQTRAQRRRFADPAERERQAHGRSCPPGCTCRRHSAETSHKKRETRAAGGSDDPRKRTHMTWVAMRRRCRVHPRYAGRGIKVCDRWFTFDNFLEDMGLRPRGTTIDRVDGDGDYEPGNCKWATDKEQTAPGRRRRRG